MPENQLMKIQDLRFDYPPELVATEPQRPSRVAWIEGDLQEEISLQKLIQRIPAGDILAINDTKVLHRRVFAGDLEILFLRESEPLVWEVLMPSKKLKVGDKIQLPLGIEAELLEKGRPQKLRVQRALTENDFEKMGELPLPPYIQKARGARHTEKADENWYQTAWAQKPGSLAAPTASLHFSAEDLQTLEKRGVKILRLTLHVGLGTFLPVLTEDLDDHPMHFEEVEVPARVWEEIIQTRASGKKLWALGTTAVRALESVAGGQLKKQGASFRGETNLLIQPGYEWKIVDRLLTNFHQPESTLLALVAAFAGLERVREVYSWAIQRQFRLFSYGDLSVWVAK